MPRTAIGYVLTIDALAVAAIAAAAARTHWRGPDLLLGGALTACGIVAIESARRIRETHGGIIRDLQGVWLLAVAVSLPPVYAMLAPAALTAYKLVRIPGLVMYRRVVSAATLSLGYGLASQLFHMIPATVAGGAPGTGRHALTWTASVAACYVLAGYVLNGGLLAVAIRLTDPSARLRDLLASRQTVTLDVLELTLAVALTLVVRINPVLIALALPAVILCRRTILQAQLVASLRIDAETGLLNRLTWRREAQTEFFLALRSRAPLSMAMMTIDGFSAITDHAGPGVAAMVVRGVAARLTEKLPVSAIAGRLGIGEFAILLPHAGRQEARRISEGLRDRIAGEPIVADDAHAGFGARPTVSIGVAVRTKGCRSLDALAESASEALREATSSGWNRVHVLPGADSEQDAGLD
jgi:diguanylate cyclase (GGDEF)-like protein